jgi:hypothetical protein
VLSYNNIINLLEKNSILLKIANHHHDYFVMIQSEEGLHKWALEQLRMIKDEGLLEVQLHEELDFLESDIYNTKSPSIRRDIQYKYDQYHKQLSTYDSDANHIKDIDNAISSGDGRKAYVLLIWCLDRGYIIISHQMDIRYYG